MEYYIVSSENVDLKKNELFIVGYEYNHLSKVLRKKTGDRISTTDGLLNVYHCIIKSIDKSKIVCSIEKTEFNLHEPDINLTLLTAPLKNLTRYEFLIEKAVELGVKKIQPVITEHTIIKYQFSKIKMERFNRIISGAVSQSQRCYLPEFQNLILFDDMIKLTNQIQNKIVMYEYSDDVTEIKTDNNSKEYYLLIGPEGGFSEEEISKLKNSGWEIKSLGNRKLRSETAAIIAVNNLFLSHSEKLN